MELVDLDTFKNIKRYAQNFPHKHPRTYTVANIL